MASSPRPCHHGFVLSMLLGMIWCGVDSARPDHEMSDETRLPPPAAAQQPGEAAVTAAAAAAHKAVAALTAEATPEAPPTAVTAEATPEVAPTAAPKTPTAQTTPKAPTITKLTNQATLHPKQRTYNNKKIQVERTRKAVPPLFSNNGNDTILHFPQSVGLYSEGMEPKRVALSGAVHEMEDAQHDLDSAINNTHESFDSYQTQMHDFDEQLAQLDPELDELDVVKKQFSSMDPERVAMFDHIPWEEYSDDGSVVRAIDRHKDRWTNGKDGQMVNKPTADSLIQMESSGMVAKLAKMHRKKEEPAKAKAEPATVDPNEHDEEEDDEGHSEEEEAAPAEHEGKAPVRSIDKNKLTPREKLEFPGAHIALGAAGAEMPGGAKYDWNHMDKEGLIKAAGELVPPARKEEAEALWRALPTDQLREWMPKYFKNIRAEADMKKYKASLEATDLMDDSGQNLAENTAKTMKSLVNVHKKMEDWHTTVKTNIRDLDKVQGGVDILKKGFFDHFRQLNKWRLSDLNALVGDERLRQFEVVGDVEMPKKRPPVVFQRTRSPFDEDGSDNPEEEARDDVNDPNEDEDAKIMRDARKSMATGRSEDAKLMTDARTSGPGGKDANKDANKDAKLMTDARTSGPGGKDRDKGRDLPTTRQDKNLFKLDEDANEDDHLDMDSRQVRDDGRDLPGEHLMTDSEHGSSSSHLDSSLNAFDAIAHERTKSHGA